MAQWETELESLEIKPSFDFAEEETEVQFSGLSRIAPLANNRIKFVIQQVKRRKYLSLAGSQFTVLYKVCVDHSYISVAQSEAKQWKLFILPEYMHVGLSAKLWSSSGWWTGLLGGLCTNKDFSCALVSS